MTRQSTISWYRHLLARDRRLADAALRRAQQYRGWHQKQGLLFRMRNYWETRDWFLAEIRQEREVRG